MEVTSVVMVRSEALGFLAYKKRRIFGCSGTVYTHEIKKIEAYNDSGHCTTYVGHNIQKHTAGPGQQGHFFSRGQLLVQQASDKPADESNQDIHQISFPRYEDIKAECPDAKYQYLFTLDDTAFSGWHCHMLTKCIYWK